MDHRENHKLKMKNFKLHQLMILEDNQWKQRYMIEILPDILQKVKSIIE